MENRLEQVILNVSVILLPVLLITGILFTTSLDEKIAVPTESGITAFALANQCITNVTCKSPPQSYCDGDTLIKYSSQGSCDPKVRKCTYSSTSIKCPSGCKNGDCAFQDVCSSEPSTPPKEAAKTEQPDSTSFAMLVNPPAYQQPTGLSIYFDKSLNVKTNDLSKNINMPNTYDDNGINLRIDEKSSNQFMLSKSGSGDVRFRSFDGYIVELKEMNVLEKKATVEQEVSKLRREISAIEQKPVKSATEQNLRNAKIERVLNLEKNLPTQLRQQSDLIDKEQLKFKSDIAGLISKNSKLEVKDSFKKTFNGVFLKGISDDEAKAIRKLSNVKKVTPNLKVSAELQDSVPLINADKLWEKGYTGNGIRIAIIDTGIDYTHPDLGGCFGSGELRAEATLKVGDRAYKVISSSDIGVNDFDIKVDISGDGVLPNFNLGDGFQDVTGDEKVTITKDDYLFLKDFGMLQYTGADKITTDNPSLRFKHLKTGDTTEQPYTNSSPLAKLKLGGYDYSVFYAALDMNSNDFAIYTDLDHSGSIFDYGLDIIADENKDILKDSNFYLLDYDGLLQYLGADKATSDNPVMRFKNLQTGEIIEQIYVIVPSGGGGGGGGPGKTSSPPIESIYNADKAEPSNLPKSQIEQIISISQAQYEVQLDIPSYLDQRLSKPNKFFSEREVKIVRKGKAKLPIIPEISTLSKRDPSTKSLISSIGIDVSKKKQDSFSFTIPKDTETGYYTIEFDIKNEKLMLPIQIYGLTQDDKAQISSLPLAKQVDESVSFVRRLKCNYCFWESVSTINPIDENYGYFVGGGASDYLVQTTDGWKSSTIYQINKQTSPKIRNFRGDPKLEFSTDNKLLVASLLWNLGEPITGGIYTESMPKEVPPKFTQTYVQSIPPNLSPEEWIIFDYEKIAVDKNSSSQFFGNTYMSVNAMKLSTNPEERGTGLVTIKPNGEIIEKLTRNVGLYQPPQSLLVGINGVLYGGRDDGSTLNKKIYRSLDGGETFLGSELPNSRSEGTAWCSPRVSNSSGRYWGIYNGPELAQDTRTGRLYAAWAKYKGCKPDPSSEYGYYAYDNDVFVSYSDNDGVSWSSPIRVNDDFTEGDQGFPDITVDKNDIVYVTFLDHRDNQDLAQFDVYLAFSLDNGQTFSKNIKLNDISVNNVYGGRDPGDYLDMISVGSEKVYITYPCMTQNLSSFGHPNDACVSVLNKPLNFQAQTPAECADGKDNDGDGFIDYPNDNGCDSKYDNEEFISISPPEGCKVAGGYDFINEDNDPMDDHGHGTHVASIAAGNGRLKGVAPDATLYAYKVLDSSGSGSFATVIAGVERSIDPNNDGDLSDHVDVLSMSLGAYCWEYSEFCGPEDPLSKAVDNAVNAGVVAVIAAGNAGPWESSIASPGTSRNAITVGAACKPSDIGVNQYCNEPIAWFSSRGPVDWPNGSLIKPDISAPGVNICAAEWDNAWSDLRCLDDKHVAISGTSMATPHIAGAAALLKQSHPEWSTGDIKSALMLSAKDLGLGSNTQGAGLADVFAGNDLDFVISPSSFSLGIIVDTLPKPQNLTIKNNRKEDIKLTFFTDCSVSSLRAEEVIVPAMSTKTVLFSINKIPSKEGTINGNIYVYYLDKVYKIPYSFRVLSQVTLSVNSGAKTSFFDAALVNENLSMLNYKFEAENSYNFFVPSGKYIAFAGGDVINTSSVEYILAKSVVVPKNKKVSVQLDFKGIRPFTVKAKALDGTKLLLYEWQKAYRIYNDKGCFFNYDLTDPSYGDRTVYVSNRPSKNLDMDVFFKYDGVPLKKVPAESFGGNSRGFSWRLDCK